MNEVVKRIHHYRGYTIKYITKDIEWIIVNNLNNPIGSVYSTHNEAMRYVDDILKV